MNWTEFAQWADDELGMKLHSAGGKPGRGGTQLLARVLGVGPIGTGRPRAYGFREQQRLRTWRYLVNHLGGEHSRNKWPDWVWHALDVAPLCPEGALVVRTARGGIWDITFHRSGQDHVIELLRDTSANTVFAIPIRGRQ